MKKSDKLIKREQIHYIYLDLDLFEGDINEISKKILDIPRRLKENVPNIDLSKYTKFDINLDKWGETIDVELFGSREETDEEYLKRINQNNKRVEANKKAALTLKKKKEQEEKELYIKLKKKFDG